MQGTEQEPGEAHLSVGWQAGGAQPRGPEPGGRETDGPEPGDQSLERAAAYVAILTRTLAAAGYQARRLDVGLRRGAHGILEIQVRGDVPRMPESDFASLARVTLNAANLAQDGDALNGVLLFATLDPGLVLAQTPVGPPAAKPLGRLGSLPLGRLTIALLLGAVLGVLGLPRLELPFLTSPPPPRDVVVVPSVPTPAPPAGPTSVPAPPTFVPAPPTVMAALPPSETLTAPRVLIAQQLLSPLANWPNDPNGSAWFGDGGFHLLARQSGRFVAVGVPLPQAVSSAIITAEFQKVGGPAGGGYGLIVRDQGSPAERDGVSQTGQYMVLEVGDRGDVGIWRRNETRWIDVLPWTHSDLVHTDRSLNALVVMLNGNALRFEVNGEAVADLTYDGVPPRGGVGIFVGGDLNEVALEWLRIQIS